MKTKNKQSITSQLFVDKTISYKINNVIKYKFLEYMKMCKFNFQTTYLKTSTRYSLHGLFCEMFLRENPQYNWKFAGITQDSFHYVTYSLDNEVYLLPEIVTKWAELEQNYIYTNVYQMVTRTDSNGEKYVKKIYLTLDELIDEGLSKENIIDIFDKSYN